MLALLGIWGDIMVFFVVKMLIFNYLDLTKKNGASTNEIVVMGI